MKQTLKREVLFPLLIIHLGIIILLYLIVLLVPFAVPVAVLLMVASVCTVGGTIMLWRFVVSELISIRKCHDAVTNGNAAGWHADRSDELGELEEELVSLTVK